MSEQITNPFDPFFEKIREIVREEIRAASNGNGHAAESRALDEHGTFVALTAGLDYEIHYVS
jgi:hypothetical protein